MCMHTYANCSIYFPECVPWARPAPCSLVGTGDRLRELVAQYTEVPQKLAADGRPSGCEMKFFTVGLIYRI